jgi:hypothetical protein
MRAHPPTLVLERWLRRESLGEGAHWAPHLETCAECAGRLGEMEREDLDYRQSARARALGNELRRQSINPRPTQRRIPRLFLPALLPAALAALALLWWHTPTIPWPGGETLRAKGPGIEVTVRRGTAAVTPWDGMPLHDGDLVQFAVSSSRTKQVALLLREGSEVSQLYPEAGDRSAAIEAGPHRPMGGSVRVDGHAISVHLFSSDEPFDLPALRAALAADRPPHFSGSRRRLELPGASGP